MRHYVSREARAPAAPAAARRAQTGTRPSPSPLHAAPRRCGRGPTFEELWDKKPNIRTFLSVADANLARVKPPDTATFIHDFLEVTPVRTGRLSADLTLQGDILIAVLLLLLRLFAIEGLVSAVLLRARCGSLHAFSLSLHCAADIARDFRVRSLLPRPPRPPPVSTPAGGGSCRRRAPARHTGRCSAAHVARAQTSPRLRRHLSPSGPVPPALPTCGSPRREPASAFVARPCAAPTLVGVEPAVTRISACLTSDLPLPDAPFARVEGARDRRAHVGYARV